MDSDKSSLEAVGRRRPAFIASVRCVNRQGDQTACPWPLHDMPHFVDEAELRLKGTGLVGHAIDEDGETHEVPVQ